MKKIKKQPTVLHLLQAQQAPALPYAKVVGRPGTGSYPAPSPDPTMCTLLGLMRFFAMGWANRGERDKGWGYDEWLWLGRWVRLRVWDWEWVRWSGVCLHPPTQLYSNQPDPTLDYIHSPPYTIPSQDTPYPLPTRPTPTSQPKPSTPPYPLHILSYPPNPHPSYPYMPTPPQRLISPSKAHISLWKFCCALTIEYKCKTSNINKRL